MNSDCANLFFKCSHALSRERFGLELQPIKPSEVGSVQETFQVIWEVGTDLPGIVFIPSKIKSEDQPNPGSCSNYFHCLCPKWISRCVCVGGQHGCDFWIWGSWAAFRLCHSADHQPPAAATSNSQIPPPESPVCSGCGPGWKAQWLAALACDSPWGFSRTAWGKMLYFTTKTRYQPILISPPPNHTLNARETVLSPFVSFLPRKAKLLLTSLLGPLVKNVVIPFLSGQDSSSPGLCVSGSDRSTTLS